MKNIKGFAIATDGSMKRIAITYDEIDENGKIVNQNVKANQIVVGEEALAAVAVIEATAQEIVDRI